MYLSKFKYMTARGEVPVAFTRWTGQFVSLKDKVTLTAFKTTFTLVSHKARLY